MPLLRRTLPAFCAVLVAGTFLTRTSPAQHLNADRDGALVLTYNVNPDYVDHGGVRCGDPTVGYSLASSYYRLFDLSAYPEITGDFNVTSVSVGVYINTFSDTLPAQEGTVSLYDLAGPLPTDSVIDADSLELVGETTFGGLAAPDDRGFIAIVEIEGSFSHTDLLVVELALPSGDPAVTGFDEWFDVTSGHNYEGVIPDAMTYFASEDCGIPDPTNIWVLVESNPWWVQTVTGTVSATATEGTAAVQRVRLGQGFPNPAAEAVTVPFSLAQPQRVRLSIADVLGREILVAADAVFNAGEHTVTLDLRRLPSGLYVYRLATETGVVSRMLTVAR